jgi:hypothetical protein
MQPSHEKALWVSVLGQATNDALGRASYNPREYPRDGGTYDPRLEAREWIEQGGPDFQAVCGLAGVDADAVLAGRVGPIYLAGPEIRKRRTVRPEGKAA